ncbi:conjugal transfer protein TraB [Streptomyces griseoluteus]|uniref:conjugal transfer protein TraB n=1 Tax=Streptomyces griseoluteus TaxID=29306 RepID=UPI00332D13F6
MSALVPRPDNLPDTTVQPSFTRLASRLVALSVSALALKEGMHALQRRLEADADDVTRTSELCDMAEVDPHFTALMREAAQSVREVAEASGEMVAAADSTAVNAQGFHDAHQGEYRGVYEAVQASGVRQAKPGFYRTR